MKLLFAHPDSEDTTAVQTFASACPVCGCTEEPAHILVNERPVLLMCRNCGTEREIKRLIVTWRYAVRAARSPKWIPQLLSR